MSSGIPEQQSAQRRPGNLYFRSHCVARCASLICHTTLTMSVTLLLDHGIAMFIAFIPAVLKGFLKRHLKYLLCPDTSTEKNSKLFCFNLSHAD